MKPGVDDVRANSALISAFTTALSNELLPTLERPTKATSGTSDSGNRRNCATLRSNFAFLLLFVKKWFACVFCAMVGGNDSQYQWKSSSLLKWSFMWLEGSSSFIDGRVDSDLRFEPSGGEGVDG